MTETLTVTRTKRATIFHDADPVSPREWSNLGTMACWHRHYSLGDVQPRVDPHIYRERLEEHLVLPLYLLDHSGITMSTTPFSCPWDSGQVGYIHVSHARIAEEYGDLSPESIERARRALVAEVAAYDTYLRGEVYGYRVDEVLVDEDGEVLKVLAEVDSCWGFFHSDDDPAVAAMQEHVPTEERPLLAAAWERGPVYR